MRIQTVLFVFIILPCVILAQPGRDRGMRERGEDSGFNKFSSFDESGGGGSRSRMTDGGSRSRMTDGGSRSRMTDGGSRRGMTGGGEDSGFNKFSSFDESGGGGSRSRMTDGGSRSRMTDGGSRSRMTGGRSSGGSGSGDPFAQFKGVSAKEFQSDMSFDRFKLGGGGGGGEFHKPGRGGGRPGKSGGSFRPHGHNRTGGMGSHGGGWGNRTRKNSTGWDFSYSYKDHDEYDYYEHSYDNKPDKYSYGDSYEKPYHKKPSKYSYDDSYEKSYDKKDDYDKDNYDDDNYDDDDDDDDDYKPSEHRSKRQRKSPDSMGNINVYFREPSHDGRRRKPKRIRFSTARYERHRSPNFGRLTSFLPWTPIFEDRLTKQTIIFSPAGGMFIIPCVINFYGQRFSVAQLLASGYASLVSSGGPPPPGVDIAPLVRPGPVVGPGTPVINPSTGGFRGGVKTEYRSFPRPDYPKVIEVEANTYQQDQYPKQGGYY